MTETTDLSDTNTQAQALKQTLDDLDSRSRSFGSALGSALASATTGGKGLDGVLQGLASRLTNIALSAGLKPLETALGGAADSLSSGIGKLFGFARGGVPGNVTAFADGGVVASPTYFPMGSDLGLMGEAGSEAILPLKRGSDGSLGVASSGGGGSSVVVNITTPDVQGFQKSQAQISAMLARTALRGQRNL
ncbi:phage tail tape measure protein [Rhizobium tumorigenes]|uniref:Phage tail tape measure protein n=1 Tax=Rhizobium tumorigenes TaxID=2041385 RepID=A0AAF1K557_9HYPH|nr:phage tail tape measure protein [Rhizobium tumorigenes]WFR96238.1 phage tail tape measure protein [Rhizobium tumorigenes]